MRSFLLIIPSRCHSAFDGLILECLPKYFIDSAVKTLYLTYLTYTYTIAPVYPSISLLTFLRLSISSLSVSGSVVEPVWLSTSLNKVVSSSKISLGIRGRINISLFAGTTCGSQMSLRRGRETLAVGACGVFLFWSHEGPASALGA